MFDVRAHIGIGAFGRVSLVRKKDTGRVFAMKSLLKKDVIVKNQVRCSVSDESLSVSLDSSWKNSCVSTWNSKSEAVEMEMKWR